MQEEHTIACLHINLQNSEQIPNYLQYSGNINDDDNITLMDYITGDILLHLKKSMMATKIQKTWRMHKIDKCALIERLDAKINKYENKGFTDEKNFANDVKKTMKRVYFENRSIVKHIDDIYDEMTDMNDGTEKDINGFTRTMAKWMSCGANQTFFDGYVKKYVDMPSSKKWNDYLEEMIEMFENGNSVILWANLGEYKIVYPRKKYIVKDFKKYWNIYESKREKDENMIIDMCISDNDIMNRDRNIRDIIDDMYQKIQK